MPKKIRWRDKDKSEIDRLIKNFNAKITRLLKKGFNPSTLPNKVSKKELMERIKTRKDFNIEVNSLLRFSKRGAEKLKTNKAGVTKTKWEFNDLSYRKKRINLRNKRELKKYYETQVNEGGEPIGFNRYQLMMSEGESVLLPIETEIENVTERNWNNFIKKLHRQGSENYLDELNELYKTNYIKALLENGFDLDFIKEIDKNSSDTFIKMLREDVFGDISFVYDPIEFDRRQEKIYALWEKYKEVG